MDNTVIIPGQVFTTISESAHHEIDHVRVVIISVMGRDVVVDFGGSVRTMKANLVRKLVDRGLWEEPGVWDEED